MKRRKRRKRALSYLRVSGKSQLAGGGFARQRRAVRKYARAHSLDLAGEYRDEGVSGKKELADRQGLAALLDAIESDGISMVLVERADRLARNLMVSEVILGQFRDVGVQVIAADGGGDLTAGDDDPTRILIRQVLGAVSQFEKSVLVLKLRAARERVRARNGRCEGRKPFGTRAGEQRTLDRIRQLRRKPPGRPRLSYAKIGAILDAEGHLTRCGKPWRPSAIFYIAKRLGLP